MNPALSDGDLVGLLKWPVQYKAGDILAFDSGRERAAWIKRLVALPGSEVAVDDFKVWVDSLPLIERSKPIWDRNAPDCRFSDVFKLGRDEYFVLGDNRCASTDSRELGPIPRKSIYGKVLFATHIFAPWIHWIRISKV